MTEPSKQADLLPCPFCGDRDKFNPSVSRLTKFAEPGDVEAGKMANLEAGCVDAGFYVECDKCAGCGPPHDNNAEAIAAWNTRAEQHAPDVLLREALGWFVDDERFVVSVGGNPNVVERMIADAHNVYLAALKGERP